MGWRAWDAYEREADERRKALTWRKRYNWRNIGGIGVIVVIAAGIWYVMN